MQSTLRSRAFPVWVAFCSAVTVAVASGITVDDSVPARIGAGFAGLAAGVALALASAAVLPGGREEKQPVVTRPEPGPAADPAPVEQTPVIADADVRRSRLEAQLAAADRDGDVESWIASTQVLLDDVFPGASGYFSALRSRPFADERARLEAHRARLETILRDFI